MLKAEQMAQKLLGFSLEVPAISQLESRLCVMLPNTSLKLKADVEIESPEQADNSSASKQGEL